MTESEEEREKKAAYNNLNAAIERVLAATGWNAGILTRWVVLAGQTIMKDGEDMSGYPRLYMNEQMPDDAVLGLIQVHTEFIKRRLLEDSEDMSGD